MDLKVLLFPDGAQLAAQMFFILPLRIMPESTKEAIENGLDVIFQTIFSFPIL
ncbi:MAG: hypothetical protein IPH62_19875 [Ignavibacteriae bacterium]|nr:hypothetical protein [Ignavibacteriota bacterium]